MTTVIDVKCECATFGPCTAKAVYLVTVHQIGACEPYADSDGNQSFMMCAMCTNAYGKKLKDWFDAAYSLAIEQGVINKCVTCDKRITGLHDLYEVESL